MHACFIFVSFLIVPRTVRSQAEVLALLNRIAENPRNHGLKVIIRQPKPGETTFMENIQGTLNTVIQDSLFRTTVVIFICVLPLPMFVMGVTLGAGGVFFIVLILVGTMVFVLFLYTVIHYLAYTSPVEIPPYPVTVQQVLNTMSNAECEKMAVITNSVARRSGVVLTRDLHLQGSLARQLLEQVLKDMKYELVYH